MARQASSKMGGLLGIVIAVIVVLAIIASPLYIGLLQADRNAASARAKGDVELIRRAVMNVDESLAQLKAIESDAEDPSADVEFVISENAKRTLQSTTTMLQQAEQRDRDRGTVTEGKQVAVGLPNAQTAKTLSAKYEQTLRKAKTAVSQLRSKIGPSDIAGNRVSALLSYAEGRLEKSRGEYQQWQASRSLMRADQLIRYLRKYGIDRSVNDAFAAQAMSADGILAATDARISELESLAQDLGAKLASLQATISDFNQRIDTLESTAQSNRMQMATMQSQRQPIHGDGSAYARLAAGAREAEAKAEALRFGTLESAEVVITGIDAVEDIEYRGGTATIGLLSLEMMAENLRGQIAAVDTDREALVAQKQHFSTSASGSEAVASQAVEEINAVAGEIEALLATARQRQTEANQTFDKALDGFRTALTGSSSGANNVNQWKLASTIADASPDTPAAELNQMLNTDGDMEATLRALAGDAAYQCAAIHSAQIDLASRMQRLITSVAKLTGSEISDEYGERIELWRGKALEALTKAENAYKQAETQVKRTQAQIDGKTIRGTDYVWQMQFGQAAVHILRANLLTELANRQAEKDKAYELLKMATEGKEQSDLLTPGIAAIQQLQSNPS